MLILLYITGQQEFFGNFPENVCRCAVGLDILSCSVSSDSSDGLCDSFCNYLSYFTLCLGSLLKRYGRRSSGIQTPL